MQIVFSHTWKAFKFKMSILGKYWFYCYPDGNSIYKKNPRGGILLKYLLPKLIQMVWMFNGHWSLIIVSVSLGMGGVRWCLVGVWWGSDGGLGGVWGASTGQNKLTNIPNQSGSFRKKYWKFFPRKKIGVFLKKSTIYYFAYCIYCPNHLKVGSNKLMFTLLV